MSVLRPLQTTSIDLVIQNIILKATMWMTELYLGILLVELLYHCLHAAFHPLESNSDHGYIHIHEIENPKSK